MIERIIALRGRGGIGKTTTINLLPALLVTLGWVQIGPNVLHGNKEDFTDVFKSADGVLLGVASAGDNFREVDTALRSLDRAGCTIVICACRTRGVTHVAMRQFTNNIQFVRKTIADNQRGQVNTVDANRLLNFL